MLARFLKELDERILSDSSLTAPVFAQLIAKQRELGLVFGDRPTCPFLRPHIITRAQYAAVADAAQIVACAVEKLVGVALADDTLLSRLGLTEREAQMARIEPRYSPLCVSSRLDAYLSDDGFQFLEYNAESPAGVADQAQIEKVLFGLPCLRDFLDSHAHWRPEPHKRLLQALLSAYRESGGEEVQPHIAIVDWEGVSTESEFHVLREYFTAEGCETTIADPRQLSYTNGGLTAGDFRIDIVYKRVVIHEFLDRCDENHPLARAYADGRVCMANSFRTKVAHKKSVFAILSDPQFEQFFTPTEIQAFRRHIPWTRRVEKFQTTFENAGRDLIDLLRSERQRFVLKPNDDYGGHGVFLGWEMAGDDWEGAIAIALDKPYVVQERVHLKKVPMPAFSDGVRMEEMFVDFNPFLFKNEVEGALIRLSSSPLLNVTSGGGQTALLVLEDY